MSTGRRGERRGQRLRDLISSRFEYFLAVLVVSASILVVVVALIIPILVALIGAVIDTSLYQPVVQGMIAIVSGVTGFFFGNRGIERAEERVREVENQLARGALAIQQERIGNELSEIRAKVEVAIEQAERASQLHRDKHKRDADRHFENADKLIDDSYNAMKAWIYGNHAYLKLDVDLPTPGALDKESLDMFKESLDMFKRSEGFRHKTDFPNDLFPKRTCYGKAVAEIWLGDDENAIQSLNMIGNDIAKMNDLFEADDIDKFLNSKFIHRLDVKVKEYLEKYR